MPMGDPRARYELLTPATGALAAIAAIQIETDDAPAMDRLLRRLAIAPLSVGDVALRDLGGIDRGLAMRPDGPTLLLTPHASLLVVRELTAWLEHAGATPLDRAAPHAAPRYPEADSAIEAAILETLSSAASPLAIDVLLRQPELWRRGRPRDPAHDATLDRLLVPPLVVGVGHANVGKSTLVNALARRRVSVTADSPGTTRDHIGVWLELAGLVVRWIDTPGIPSAGPTDALEAAAIALARPTIQRADLIVSCADTTVGFLPDAELGAGSDTPILRCVTRVDMGPPPAHADAPVETAASPADGTEPRGLDLLARTVRDTLVPPEARTASIPWRFHPSLP